MSPLTAEQHLAKAVEYEVTAAYITVRGRQDVQDPECFWTLAVVHRAWAARLQETTP